jgi:3-oxoacyl-[acyl-carrier-protein] synthase II
MSRKTVVVTGMGCITPVGHSVHSYCDFVVNFLNRISSVEQFNDNVRRVKSFVFSDEKVSPNLDIACKYLLKAADQALTDSGVDVLKLYDTTRIAVIIGTKFGVFESQEQFLYRLKNTGIAFPMLFQQTANNLLSGIIAYRYGITGFNTTICNGWTSGLDAMILGEQLICNNEVDLAIVGGVDFLNEPIAGYYTELIREGMLTQEFVIGEGSGVVIMEAKDAVIKHKRQYKGQIVKHGQLSFYEDNQVSEDLINILDNLPDIEVYMAGFNGSNFDAYDNYALDVNGFRCILAIM